MKRKLILNMLSITSALAMFLPSLKSIGYADDSERSVYTMADICALQDFLLTKDTDVLIDHDYDLNDDGIWNAVDLCFMKRQFSAAEHRTISVSNSQELQMALAEVQPGDTILLSPGTYQTDQSGKSASFFCAQVSGTEKLPITLKSADPENPAVLSGNDSSKNIVLYIIGEYWNIENLICCNAKKGIMLDQASHSVIRNAVVYHIGEEGIHLRDGSSECQVLNCRVYDTGLSTPQYGEAIYIGSAKSTTGYSYECHNNLVSGCILGPNVAADHVDVKEYTTGNIIENCVMYGGGMTATDSFVDIKGNHVVVRGNICDAQGNTNITDAFQVRSQVDGWGIDNLVHGNTVTFAGETEYVVRSWRGSSCTVYDNIRQPENPSMMYRAYSGSTITEQ